MHWRDGRLIAELRAGDREAQGRLLADVYPRLFAYLCYLCGDQEQAADLAQEAAVRMWRALPDLDVRSLPSLLAWAHKVARSAYLDAARARQEPLTGEADRLAAPGPDPAEEALAHLNGKAALAAVARLPEVYRDVVVLRFLQGFAYREVAAVLDIPPGTVRSRLAKAMALLRADLRKEDGHDL